jgi:hypothetical protein
MPQVMAWVVRTMCGIWLAVYIVNSPIATFGSTTTPRGSMAFGISRRRR